MASRSSAATCARSVGRRRRPRPTAATPRSAGRRPAGTRRRRPDDDLRAAPADVDHCDVAVDRATGRAEQGQRAPSSSWSSTWTGTAAVALDLDARPGGIGGVAERIGAGECDRRAPSRRALGGVVGQGPGELAAGDRPEETVRRRLAEAEQLRQVEDGSRRPSDSSATSRWTEVEPTSTAAARRGALTPPRTPRSGDLRCAGPDVVQDGACGTSGGSGVRTVGDGREEAR